MPVGTDVQLVRDENGVHIVDTATGRPVEPVPGGAPRAPGPIPYDIGKREDALASETCTAFSRIPGWDLALITMTVTDTAAPVSRCLLFATRGADPDLEPWLDTDVLPSLPFVGDPPLPPRLVADIAGRSAVAQYDGYGSCPLTVERGKIVLAEFGYGGALKPSFPAFMIDGTKPSRAAWFLKEKMLPPIYWQAMLRGREWMAKPEKLETAAK